MKRNLFYYLFAVVCTVCLCTACSDDDDDEKVLTLNQVEGTYNGVLEVIGQSVPNVPISVAKVNESKVTVQLKNFSFSGITIGEISAECTAVLDSDGGEFDLRGTTTVKLADLGNVELPVVVEGDVNARKLDIDIIINNVPALGSIKVEYEGTK